MGLGDMAARFRSRSGIHPMRLSCIFLLLRLTLGATSIGAGDSVGARSRSLQELASPLQVIQQYFILRMSGPSFVPFTVHNQEVLLQAFNDTLVKQQGPMELTTYREGFPDPTSIDNATGSYPYVDVIGLVYDVWDGSSTTPWQPDVESLVSLVSRTFELGNWTQATHRMRLVYLSPLRVEQMPAITPRTLTVLQAVLAAQLADGSGGTLLAEQATALAVSVLEAIVVGDMGTLVQVRDHSTSTIQAMLGPELGKEFLECQLVLLEVTLYQCQGVAMNPTQECEQQLLRQRLEQLVHSGTAAQSWVEAGLAGVEVAHIRPRPSPEAPAPRNDAQARPWVPWHLDRIDQRGAVLDGQFNANASGTGVNVYLISSGIRADHQEFGYQDGRQGTRVKAAWGYKGLNPLEDCPDSFAWYGFGTLAASIIGGRNVGVAKNVTIHSVRFRGSCLVEDPGSWTQGLIDAIESVLRNHTKPAVLAIDAWLRSDRFTFDDDLALERALKELLDQCLAANITVVTMAGERACENYLANVTHPSLLRVGSSGWYDIGNSNSTCMDLWAPGDALTGAHPSDIAEYRTVAMSGNWLAAGVAAQYLSLHPGAGPEEVKQALIGMSTPHAVTGPGPAATTRLLFTNLTEPYRPGEGGPGGTGTGPRGANPAAAGGGSSSKSLVPILVPITLVVAAILAIATFVAIRARRGAGDRRVAPAKFVAPMSLLAGPEWEIPEDQIEICKRPDGSDCVLGQGSYGQVFKAIKGGVQVVAVKKLRGCTMDGPRKEQFVQEISLMKYVSRDANVMQFYGACVAPTMMLVVELMEGGDLRNALTADRAGELGWYRAGKGIALDILRGLHFLHASHVIHRDIKSKNILLTREGRAKIADVGLAQVLEGDGEQGETESFVGTFAWAGPELILGDTCTEKVDMYSFGVVLWEIVTQEVPLRGCLHDPEVPRHCPQLVADTIHACLKRDPSLRPTARELYSTLLACPPADGADGSTLSPPTTNDPSVSASCTESRPHSDMCGTPAGSCELPNVAHSSSPTAAIMDQSDNAGAATARAGLGSPFEVWRDGSSLAQPGGNRNAAVGLGGAGAMEEGRASMASSMPLGPPRSGQGTTTGPFRTGQGTTPAPFSSGQSTINPALQRVVLQARLLHGGPSRQDG